MYDVAMSLYRKGGKPMEYMTTKGAAERWGFSEETIRKWCKSNQLSAAVKAEKVRGRWRIPANVECPRQIKTKKKG